MLGEYIGFLIVSVTLLPDLHKLLDLVSRYMEHL